MTKKGLFLSSLISVGAFSLAAQALSLLRHILIAAYFGVSRGLDIYFMSYAIATVCVFSFGMIFDSVGIPHLVRAIEKEGMSRFRYLTGSIFSFSLIFTLFINFCFLILLPVFILIMSAGFSAVDKNRVWHMSFYFLPWTLISIPYYVICSFYKSLRYFNRVFLSEIIVAAVSVVVLILYHPGPYAIPLAIFAGYLAAFLWLIVPAPKYFSLFGNIMTRQSKNVYMNFMHLFGANQVGNLASLSDRAFQSFLSAGGISALSYVSQMVNNIGSILSFREIFIVPLSSLEKRAQRLERAIIGLILLTVPIMLFISAHSSMIITLLLKRGMFNSFACRISSEVLSLYVLSLLPVVVGLPVFRMFQVIDRIKNTAWVYLLSAASITVFGYVFVLCLKLEACGMALTAALQSYLTCVLSLILLQKEGIRINKLLVCKYLLYSLFVCEVSIYITGLICSNESSLLIRMIFSMLLYFGLVISGYLPIWRRMSYILYPRT